MNTQIDHTDAKSLRQALGHFATGVAVLGGVSDDGHPFGATINSFSAVSLDPPLILFSLKREAAILGCFVPGKPFSVSVLAEDQKQLSGHFCTPLADKWSSVVHERDRQGCPRLLNTLASFSGVIHSQSEGGDHIVVFGKIEELAFDQKRDPLLFFKGSYHGLPSTLSA